MKLTPVGDQVLVKLDPYQSNSALMIPDVCKEKSVWGTVEAVGTKRAVKRKGKLVELPVTVKVGDRVCVAWATGHDLTINGSPYLFVHEWGPKGDGVGGILAVESSP
jgi:co-chaperonin GroES (HSP10)